MSGLHQSILRYLSEIDYANLQRSDNVFIKQRFLAYIYIYIFSRVATKRIESKTLSLTVCYTAVDSTLSDIFSVFGSTATLRQIFLIPYMRFCCRSLYIVIIKQCKLDKIIFTVEAQGIGIVLLLKFVSCTVFLV